MNQRTEELLTKLTPDEMRVMLRSIYNTLWEDGRDTPWTDETAAQIAETFTCMGIFHLLRAEVNTPEMRQRVEAAFVESDAGMKLCISGGKQAPVFESFFENGCWWVSGKDGLGEAHYFLVTDTETETDGFTFEET